MKEEDYNPWTSMLLRSLGCTLVSAPIAYWMGPAVAIPTAVLWGVALARPIIEASTSVVRQMRALSYRGVSGVYYEHAGQAIEVIENDDARWLRAAQVQRLLGDTVREAVFAHRFGPQGHLAGEKGRWYVRDDALLDYLERPSNGADPRRNHLRLFVLREVRNPHRHRRSRRPLD